MVPSNHSNFQYCNSNIGFFSIAPCKVITLNPLCILFVLILCFIFYGSFSLLKALEKSNSNLFAITLEREPSKKKQRTDTKKDGTRIKSDHFKRSNREKSNIAIAILEI